MTNHSIVIGLGNPLMTDEGIGNYLVNELSKRITPQNQESSFLDLGTSSFRVLHSIAGKQKAIFIDCALMGEKPGTLRRFTPQNVHSIKDLPNISLHEGDLLSTLELSRKLNECPSEVIIFGIEPQDVSPGQDFSPSLRSRLSEYLNVIEAEIL